MLFENINSQQTIGETSFVNHYAGINNSMFVAKLKPSISQAVQLNILKIIKEDFYNNILDKFNTKDTDTESAEFIETNKRAIESLQSAIANYAICRKLEEGNASLSELGLQYRTDGENTSATIPQWQFFATKYDLSKKADAFFEVFLNFAFKNQEKFGAFNTEIDTYFIQTPRELSDVLSINNSIMTFIALLPAMKKTSQKLKKLLGLTLYETMLSKARTNSADGIYKELLEAIQQLVAYKSLLISIPFLNIDLENGKIFTATETDGYRTRSKANEEQLNRLTAQLEKDAAENEQLILQIMFENNEILEIEQQQTYDYNKVVVSKNSIGLF